MARSSPRRSKITGDLDQLLAFYDYPAEHWVHLRTTNPIVIWSLVLWRGCDLGGCVEDGVLDTAA